MSATAPAIEVEGLGKNFGAAAALHRVAFAVEAGGSLAIFGPNGAGKTTLLRILATLARPSSGSVRIDGTETTRAPAELRRRIGFLSHRSLLYPALSAFDNVAFFARMFGVEDAAERSRRLLVRFGLEHRLDDPVETFSRGMEQRCAIARALVHEPEILLLDEPFSGLDTDARDRLKETIAEARGRRTVLLTTHDLSLGSDLADEVAVLHRGRLAARARVADIPGGDVAALYRKHVGGAAR